MSEKRSEQIRSTEEGRRLVEETRAVMEATENLCRAMADEGVTKDELARRTGQSALFVREMLECDMPIELQYLSRAAHALGRSLHVSFGPPTDTCHVVAPSPDLDRLRGENERLRKFVEETTAVDCGCATGDCPHSLQTECFDAIVAALKEVGDGARAALEPQ